MAVHDVPPLACFQRFVRAMRELWQLDLADEERWQRVRALLPMLLDDPELRELAGGWAETRAADGKHTNLLLYEDPQHGFVVNALVKGPGRVRGRLTHRCAHRAQRARRRLRAAHVEAQDACPLPRARAAATALRALNRLLKARDGAVGIQLL